MSWKWNRHKRRLDWKRVNVSAVSLTSLKHLPAIFSHSRQAGEMAASLTQSPHLNLVNNGSAMQPWRDGNSQSGDLALGVSIKIWPAEVNLAEDADKHQKARREKQK